MDHIKLVSYFYTRYVINNLNLHSCSAARQYISFEDFLGYVQTEIHRYKSEYSISTFIMWKARDYRSRVLYQIKREQRVKPFTLISDRGLDDILSIPYIPITRHEDTNDKIEAVKKVLLTITSERNRLLILDYVSGLTAPELAIKYNISKQRSNQIIHKLIYKLRDKLNPNYNEPINLMKKHVRL